MKKDPNTKEMEYEQWFSSIMSEKGIHPDEWADFEDEYKEIYEGQDY